MKAAAVLGVFAVLLTPARGEAAPDPALSVVELSVTYQEYDQSRPWRKEKEQHRHAYGCLLPSGDILTTADIIRDYTLIKVERPGAQNNVPAKVRVV
ncbi:MAG TPA: hypothetical protein PLI51_08135, partial [bacterium]|nr:hypothetical protein [bacterium]